MSALPVKARLMILQAEESAKSAQTIQAMGRFRSWLMVAATVIIAGTFLLSSDFFLRVFM
ncbi:hypothetical protein [Thioalkalivibrio thiocyanodenitrificans]|uniref:hypothetical protein n=1 Tax=Thioalkalivibrio thiocyanodenitrificans TaxID=243063 RepID=UPI0003A80BB1|nr:hypothetical protein [Thioalkalivibrio thiocyanodenitrificans]